MFNINGDYWQIKIVSNNHPALRRMDGTFTLGCCDNNLKTIFIVDNLSNAYYKKVLCHEVTHACMFSYGVNLTAEQEELLADLVATYGQEIISTTNSLFVRLKQKKGTW